jgi:hypothetical protein
VEAHTLHAIALGLELGEHHRHGGRRLGRRESKDVFYRPHRDGEREDRRVEGGGYTWRTESATDMRGIWQSPSWTATTQSALLPQASLASRLGRQRARLIRSKAI